MAGVSFDRPADDTGRQASRSGFWGTLDAAVDEPAFRRPQHVSMETADDSVYVRRCLAGDPSAFEPLVERYHRPLINLAARLLGNRDEALDITQTAFVKAFEHLASFDTNQRFFSWIYQIARNECLNALRARRPSAPLPEDLAASGSPADDVEREQLRVTVQAALMQLSDDQREIVLLRHFTELSYDEIAASTGIPAKTVKSRLYSARQRLASLLALHGRG